MRRMGIGLLLTVSLLTGCGPRVIRLTEADTFENRHVVFQAPLGEWYILKNREWSRLKEADGREWKHFDKDDIPGVSYTVKVETSPL